MHLRGFSALLLTLMLLMPLPCPADDSGPSNTVGFWKTDVQHGYTQMSFPLLPDDKSLDNVLGDQLTGGSTSGESDQILRWNAAGGRYEMSWFNSGALSWEGEIETLSEAESYWVYVQESSPTQQTIVTYGNVVETASYDMGTMTPGYNAIGSVWAVSAPLSSSGLDGFEGGLYLFLSDLIMGYDASTGSYRYAWQDGSSNWQGDLTELEPLMGYWIYIAPGHTGFDWSNYYQPNPIAGSGLLINGNVPATNLTRVRPGMPPIPNPENFEMNQSPPSQATSAKGGVQ
jgi:hypothetical protein